MTEEEAIHVADVSEGMGGDATAQFELFRPPEKVCKITLQTPNMNGTLTYGRTVCLK